MKKILFVGAEVMPFAATGGLGDVLGSLPAALTQTSDEPLDIRVVLPLYEAVKMLTKVPAEIMGLNKGVLAEGRDADIIVFDDGVNVKDIFVGGKKIV
jgi:glycogen synthase